MTTLTRYVTALALVLLPLFAAAKAAEGEGSAHEVVRAATERVMSEVESADDYIDEHPERFYSALDEILDPVVDFRGFARGVMGAYASSERYRSLDQAGREKLREQLERFTEVMRQGLVRTYGKGLLAFGGSRIDVPVPEVEEGASRVAVQQFIHAGDKAPYEVVYYMGRDGDGLWKLRNMVIEDVNLGKIYQSQFESAARKYDGNLDQVIANWSAVELDDAGETS
ncbi:MlaC/ttg2D family ABC transporter substrate-binding protein [Haliea atlantica]|jgi:phospholipid transport system substrate-binding protein